MDSLNSILGIPTTSAGESSGDNSSTDNNSSESSSTPEIITTSTDPIITSATSTDQILIDTSTEAIVTSTEVLATSTDPVEVNETKIKLLISRIYVSGDNDLIELYNPMNIDIDLAAGNYRLEKTKTAVDPAILMRFGNPADGVYPGGTVIKSGGTYLIARDKAEATIRDKAQAIANSKTFTFDSNGYTVYLGDDAISGPTDDNIIDYVGFGPAASFYEGLSPAPEILDNYILQRKVNNGRFVDSDNNGDDFSLLDL